MKKTNNALVLYFSMLIASNALCVQKQESPVFLVDGKVVEVYCFELENDLTKGNKMKIGQSLGFSKADVTPAMLDPTHQQRTLC